jgi:hypothetical protein
LPYLNPVERFIDKVYIDWGYVANGTGIKGGEVYIKCL